MQRSQALLITLACVTLAAACRSAPSGEGNERVHLTKNPREVASCTPAGDVYVDSGAIDLFRRRVSREGGNAALVIDGTAEGPIRGIVYRCP